MAEPDRDPRIERSRRRVLRAALDELAIVGYGAFAIESVARRSGVAKSTIYRHWPGKPALILDAMETLNVQPGSGADADPSPPPPTARARIEQLIDHLATAFRDSPLTASTPALIEAAEHDQEIRAVHHGYNARRRQRLVDAIAAGVESGELPRSIDPELAALALAGTILYCRVMTGEPFDPARVPDLLTTVIGPAS
jgi:AcrR family transcriptional regulator